MEAFIQKNINPLIEIKVLLKWAQNSIEYQMESSMSSDTMQLMVPLTMCVLKIGAFCIEID